VSEKARKPAPSTVAAQALGWTDPTFRDLVPPIHPSVSYERSEDGGYPGGHSYGRDQNPTFDQAEAVIAALEGGAGAMLFASGMAAATTLFEILEPGAHIVAPRQMYWTIQLWLRDLAARGRIELDLVPNGDLDALRAALRPGATRLVWVETPSNPMCAVTDIAATAEVAHAAGARVAADGTLATPVLTRALELGADVVMHSATKQLNGHADVLAGALVTASRDESWERARFERGYRGAVPGPFDAWLLLRGLRTLVLRVGASARGALRVAEFLSTHEDVIEVFYPGLPTHPGHALAASQMHGGFGPMLSFRVRGGERRARATASSLELFHQASSLGGVESLVEHRASVEGPGTEVPSDLLRLSIGIEDPEDLVSDLVDALRLTR
jgi:cystathionine gamma-synthase